MAQTKQISLQSNTDWTASNIPAWLSLDKTSGTGNAVINTTAQDNTGAARSDNIDFNTADNTQHISYPVSQEAYIPPAPTLYSYVVYDDGGTYTGGALAGDYAAGTSITAPTSAVRAGYTFANFQYYHDGGYYAVHLGATFSMPAGDITLQAIWEANPPAPEYAIVTVENGNSIGSCQFAFCATDDEPFSWNSADASSVSASQKLGVNSDWKDNYLIVGKTYTLYWRMMSDGMFGTTVANNMHSGSNYMIGF
jgi:hypothetical protein